MAPKTHLLAAWFVVMSASLSTADVIISEFLANNDSGLLDDDGDNSDWIELYNGGTAPVDLAGWRLTDDDGDHSKWILPAVTLDPKGFLLVFASGKDRADPGAALHAGFKLSAGGGYLALVRPDDSVASVFDPYPAQYPDRPYGVGQTVSSTSYLGPAGGLKFLVPANDALGTAWTGRLFNDSGWGSGSNGAGFETFVAGWRFLYVKGSSTISNLAAAEAIIASPPGQSTLNTVPVFNFVNSGGTGNYGDDINPSPLDSGDIEDYAVEGTGVVTIPAAGVWSFGINSDDGGRIQIDLDRNGDFDGPGETFNDDSLHGTQDYINQFSFPAAADYLVRVVVFERGGGSAGEVFARAGSTSGWDPSFRLVGDTAGGGLGIKSAPISGGTSGYLAFIGTNLEALMYGASPQRSSVFLRYAFEVPNPAVIATLSAAINYDDGFVAYINGVEAARRNVPAGTPAHDATAASDRPASQAVLAETIDFTSLAGSLVAGTNVLAIHLLNDAPNNGDLLMRPQLAEHIVSNGATSFFTTGTPGDFNTASVYNKVAPVIASVERGLYTTPQGVSLATATPGAVIYYSFDGSLPSGSSPTSAAYTGPITIDRTTTLRYLAEKAGADPSDAVTQTYLFPADIKQQSANNVVEGGANPAITNPAGAAQPTTTWPRGTFSNGYYRLNNQIFDLGMDSDVVESPSYGPSMEASLRALPSFSLVTDLDHLFDPASGIYANPGGDEVTWERPASLEMIQPDGTPGFQVNCGIRIRGGYSRSTDNPKHAFRVFFRGSYGAGKLYYPVFGNDPTAADTFDKIDLRCSQNYSWSFDNNGSNFFVPDQFSRRSELAMGGIGSHSLACHLYVNGQYWGLFDVDERPDARFGATYLGGDPENFDTVKVDPDLGYNIEATDGNLDAWYDLWQLADGITPATGNAVHQQMLGRNPDGSVNPAYPVLLDPSSLTDCAMIDFWSGDIDSSISGFLGNEAPNNWFGFRDRTGASGGFRFVQHDSEHTLRNINENRLGPWPAGDSSQQGGNAFMKSSPQYLCTQLLQYSSDFRVAFADRVYRHFFNGGPMTVPASLERLGQLRDEVLLATIAESARWGDSKGHPGHTQASFIGAIEGVPTPFITGRNSIFISQLQAAGWYPAVQAVTWSQRGGVVSPGYQLTLGSPSGGTVYYTLDGSDPRALGGGVGDGAQVYSAALNIGSSQTVTARVLSGGAWSPLDFATFYTTHSYTGLVVSEIHYHPLPDGATSDSEFEFIEFKNISSNPLDLGGLSFSNGISHSFPLGTMLAPGAFHVLVRNPVEFAWRYPGVVVNGTYTGKLDNAGERVRIVTALGSEVIDFSYNEKAPWPIVADGFGFSIVPVDPAAAGDPGDGSNWRGSTNPGGSPGADDPPSAIPAVVISEALANSVLPQVDYIELHNPTGSTVNVGGWYLSDSAGQPVKYRIAPGTLIAGGGYLAFTEADFNPDPGVEPSFSLNSNGEQVYLCSGNAAGDLTGYSHGFEFAASDESVAFGRYLNSVGSESFPAQISASMGDPNSGPRVGPLVINEIHYEPLPGHDEFVEIRNISAGSVNLWDPANPANTWRIAGINYVFPPSTSLPGGGYALVVNTDPEAFRSKYAVPAGVLVLGPCPGALDNAGERLSLDKPGPPYLDALGETVVPYVVVDTVRYDNRSPWPTSAAGSGPSLQRTLSGSFGDDPANWFASGSTPGLANAVNLPPTCVLVSPSDGATFTLPGIIPLFATASDADGLIDRVEFYDGSTKIGEDSTAPYTFPWTSAGPGPHVVSARAIDLGAAITESDPVTIQVGNSPPGVPGSGLLAEYYIDQNGVHLSDPPFAVRTETAVDWADSSGWPGTSFAGLGTSDFSVRWSGKLLPPYTSTYNFYTLSDDGVRLYIDGVPLIYNWTYHGTTENLGSVQLNAGQLYDIVLEFFQGGGGSRIRLDWEASGAGLAREVIPAANMYPAGGPIIITDPADVTLGTGTTATFGVLAAGTEPLGYQWQFGATDIAGANGQSFFLQNPLPSQAGTYRVRVSNSYNPGGVTSNSATLVIPDSDGDGIPDYWENRHGLDPGVNDAGLDRDGDGATNGEEFLMATDPNDRSSHLTFVLDPDPDGPGWQVSFVAQANRSYTLIHSETLAAGDWTPVASFPAQDIARTVVHPLPAGGMRGFYRLAMP